MSAFKGIKFKKFDNGTGMSFEFTWSKSTPAKIDRKVHAAQIVVDSEFVRYMIRNMPKQSGELEHRTLIVNARNYGKGLVIVPGPSGHFLNTGYVMVGVISGKAYANSGESKVYTSIPLQYHGGPGRESRFVERTASEDGPKIVLAAQKAYEIA